MNESLQNTPEQKRIEHSEDEIELMDYLMVLWKWKYIILAGTLICAVAATVISFQMTKVYGIETVLQPGMLTATEDGKITYIDSPQNIKGIIEAGVFDNPVLKDINVPNRNGVPESLKFKVTIPRGTNALKVLYEATKIDLGLKVLNNLNKGLLERYDKLKKYYQENYDKEIRLKSNEVFKLGEKIINVNHAISTTEAESERKISGIVTKISAKRAEISTTEAESEATTKAKDNKIATIKAESEARKNQIKNLRKRISDIKLEIDRVSKNSDLLIEQRNRFLSTTKNEDNVLSALIYTNTIQRNIEYLNTLRSNSSIVWSKIYQEEVGIERLKTDLKNLETQKESLQNETKYKLATLNSELKDLETQEKSLQKETNNKIGTLNSEIKKLESEKKYKFEEIDSLEFIKSNIQNVQIVKPPTGSSSPIRPKTMRNIMLATVVGLFLMVFLAFFLEYVSKYKHREEGVKVIADRRFAELSASTTAVVKERRTGDRRSTTPPLTQKIPSPPT